MISETAPDWFHAGAPSASTFENTVCWYLSQVMTISHACCAALAIVRALEMPTYAATQQIPQPASTRPGHTAFQSKGRA